MRAHYRLLAAAAFAVVATAAVAQTQTATNPATRQGDIFHYAPLNGAPGTSLSNPFTNGANPLSRSEVKPHNNVVTPVPEPSQWAMMLAGLALVGYIVRRNSKRP